MASVDDYENNKIKKHECTIKKKEDDRTRLTSIQNANIGPVFLAFDERNRVVTDEEEKNDLEEGIIERKIMEIVK